MPLKSHQNHITHLPPPKSNQYQKERPTIIHINYSKIPTI